jgi:hypothetical protein
MNNFSLLWSRGRATYRAVMREQALDDTTNEEDEDIIEECMVKYIDGTAVEPHLFYFAWAVGHYLDANKPKRGKAGLLKKVMRSMER